jgi:hypothetical protein
MKAALLALALCFVTTQAFAQGELLNKGESAFSGYMSYARSEGFNSPGFGVVYSGKGIIDFGTGLSKSGSGFRSAWMMSLNLAEHIVRFGNDKSGQVIASLFQGYDLVLSESGPYNSSSVGLLGLGLTTRTSMFEEGYLLISAAYLHAFDVQHSSSNSNILRLEAVFAFRVESGFISISPSMSTDAERESIGCSLSYSHINRQHRADN